jgi:hypothetical protein
MWRWMCCLGQRFVICSFCFKAVKRQFTKEKNENLWQLKTIKNIYFHIIFSLNVMKWTKYYIYCFYLFTSAHLSLLREYLLLSSPWKDVLTYLNKKQLKNKHTLDSFFLECHKTFYIICKPVSSYRRSKMSFFFHFVVSLMFFNSS